MGMRVQGCELGQAEYPIDKIHVLPKEMHTEGYLRFCKFPHIK
jgi:hypothetical protein